MAREMGFITSRLLRYTHYVDGVRTIGAARAGGLVGPITGPGWWFP
jgi:hypothetical protein